MTTSNTHLIAARYVPDPDQLTGSKTGEKCKHAHDWGIDVVNHLWLEETYAKWQVQSVTIPRYTHFPPQTNLTEIVDKTEIQDEGIVDFYMPAGQEDEEETSELHPMTVQNGGATYDVQSSCVQQPIQTKTPAAQLQPTKTTQRAPQTPINQITSDQTPGSSKRKAAEQALDRLHNEIMPDVLLWQKEKNRKRFPTETPTRGEQPEKRRKVKKQKNEEKENVEAVQKKVKESNTIESKITLLVTGAGHDFLNVVAIKVHLS
jgi:hypothetical protein